MSDAAVRAGFRRARDVARVHAKSFYFASFALAPAPRRAALALYAFCRRLDDLVDGGDGEPRALAARLGEARRLVASLYAGPLHVVPPWHPEELAALAATVRRWSIPEAPIQELIDGVEMDLVPRRFADFAALDVYCYRVAGTVGLMLAPVLGYRDPAALGPAADLGRAMQQTNILRDVAEDLARGRVYLPQDELAAAGLDERDLARGVVDARWRGFMQAQVARARAYYARARGGVPYLTGVRSRLTVRLMAAVYGDILRVIEAQDYDVFARRAVVSGRRKLALAAAVLRQPAAA